MIIKVHSADGKKMVAVCDEELLGKKFKEGEFQIDLTGSFYRGEKTDEKELDEMVKNAYLADFVGKKSVEYAQRKGLATDEGVMKIDGIPHAQIFMLD
jgi:uncharacterized protein